MQRLYGIGTIEVTIHATTTKSGIELYDLKNYRKVYNFLLEKTKHNPLK